MQLCWKKKKVTLWLQKEGASGQSEFLAAMCEALKGKEWIKTTFLSRPSQDVFPRKMVCYVWYVRWLAQDGPFACSIQYADMMCS
jgi:hypothetical protein